MKVIYLTHTVGYRNFFIANFSSSYNKWIHFVTYSVVLVVFSFLISLVSLALTLTLYEQSKTEENDQWRNTFYDTFLLGLAYFCWISKFSIITFFFPVEFFNIFCLYTRQSCHRAGFLCRLLFLYFTIFNNHGAHLYSFVLQIQGKKKRRINFWKSCILRNHSFYPHFRVRQPTGKNARPSPPSANSVFTCKS